MLCKAKETGGAKQSKGEGGICEENKKYLCLLTQHAENQAEGHVTGGRKDVTTLGKDTKDPTTCWGSERIGCKD